MQTKPQTQKTRRWIWIALIALAISAAIGIGRWWLLGSPSSMNWVPTNVKGWLAFAVFCLLHKRERTKLEPMLE